MVHSVTTFQKKVDSERSRLDLKVGMWGKQWNSKNGHCLFYSLACLVFKKHTMKVTFLIYKCKYFYLDVDLYSHH